MLDDMEYTRDRSGLFERFLKEVASCSPVYDESKRCVTVEDMRYLYLSEPYSIPLHSSFATGEALLGFAEQLFRKADESNDGFLDLEETRKFFRDLFWDPTEEELQEVFHALDQDGDGMVNIDVSTPRAGAGSNLLEANLPLHRSSSRSSLRQM